MSPRPVALVGTTASGKSAVAMAVATRRPGTELVCVDSMTVYREMDIGTAKPSPAARAAVPHHLLDLVDPGQEFTVAEFQLAARTALAGIAARGHAALLVGGTGLYLRAVVDDLEFPGRYPELAAVLEQEADGPEGLAQLYARLTALDPLAASRTTDTNRRRIVRALEVTIGAGRPFSSFGPGLTAYPPSDVALVGLPFDPAVVDRRIEERFRRWIGEGLVDEVRRLATRAGGLSRTARQALGYKELLAHVVDGVALDECVDEAIRRTRTFARRQMSWFRRDPRIRWASSAEDAASLVTALLDGTGDTGDTADAGDTGNAADTGDTANAAGTADAAGAPGSARRTPGAG